MTSESNTSIHHWAGFEGGHFDPDTALTNDDHRWYDPVVGRWISEDPTAFAAGDANLARAVKNDPASLLDGTGLSANPPGWPPIDWTLLWQQQIAQEQFAQKQQQLVAAIKQEQDDIYNSMMIRTLEMLQTMNVFMQARTAAIKKAMQNEQDEAKKMAIQAEAQRLNEIVQGMLKIALSLQDQMKKQAQKQQQQLQQQQQQQQQEQQLDK